MGGFNPRKVEVMERTVVDLKDFSKHLEQSGRQGASKQIQQALTVIQHELKRLKKEEKSSK